MIEIYNDPKGEAYCWLIDYAMSRCPVFALADRGWKGSGNSCSRVFEALEPYLIRMQSCESAIGTSATAYSLEGTIYYYRCDPEAAIVIKEAASSLFAWQHPHLPEDLCFLDENGKDWLYNVAHERMAGLHIGETEGKEISETVDGLFLKGGFNSSLDYLIRDAIRHQADKLHIEGFGIDRIPEQIGLIRSLVSLTVFEDDVVRLPDSLFELELLEHLRIWTKDLECIPPQIGKLHSLKTLEISCGCYTRLKPGEPVIDKSEVSVTELPAEIGLLANLEILTIHYTGIRSLPPEFTNLQKLKFLDITNNEFDCFPPEIECLPNLQHVCLGNGWVDVRAFFRIWEERLGLAARDRGEWMIRQQLNGRNETEYIVELKWTPAAMDNAGHGEPYEGETSTDKPNPPGTVLVSVDAYSGRLCSYLVVRSEEWFEGAGPAGPMLSACADRKKVALKWIYANADFREEADRLQFVKETESRGRVSLHFREVYDGVPLYPPNPISVDILEDGTVTGYSSYGTSAIHHFFDSESVAPVPAAGAVREYAREYFTLVHIPDRLTGERNASRSWLYGMEETFIDFRSGVTVPYEFDTRNFGKPPLNRSIEWTEEELARETVVPAAPANEKIGERIRRFIEAAEIRSTRIDWNVKHPDGVPIGEEEAERAYRTVIAWAMRTKPEQSGIWMLERLTRHNGMLVAAIRRKEEAYRDILGKIKLFLDANSGGLIEVMERSPAEPASVPELLPAVEAFARLEEQVVCKPYYVWNSESDSYRFMHLLDCETFVDAQTGECLDKL
jgi:hypothetical protein